MKLVLRKALFAYLAIVFYPIQYWALTSNDPDNTLALCLELCRRASFGDGAGHCMDVGTNGLSRSAMDIGNNLVQGLAFQAAL
jgi:hypothetical protein